MLTRIPVDLTVPSLEALSYVLRHREHWPAGFEWEFANCEACAMGVMHCLWPQIPRVEHPIFVIYDIFLGHGDWMPLKADGCRDYAAVTPKMVADQIDLYLARQGQ